MNNYKVCILAAGVGERMGSLSENVNKAILPVNFKASISYIIEKFPEDVEIVIAVGHKKDSIKEYLRLAHPQHKFTFVEVDRYMGPGTGPGYSLLQCKSHLSVPFIFFAADTLVLEDIPAPTDNWFGVAPTDTPEKFCTVKTKNDLVYQIDDKIKTDNTFAFIGLAGVKDHGDFFEALEKNKQVVSGEIQVSNGFKKLIEKKLVAKQFTWFDTGSMETYVETNKNFSGGDKKFDFSKGDEFLYFVGDRVIKYFANSDICKKRVTRSLSLAGLCPKIVDHTDHVYGYKKVDGQTVYTVLNNKVVLDFLNWAKEHLWIKKDLNPEKQKEFDEAAHKFYYEKTMKRLKMFYEKTHLPDEENIINGVKIPPLKEMLDKVDWKHICSGIPSNFHGDLQFDNVLVNKDPTPPNHPFTLLDWRQDFGGLVEFGDLYYDLSKLYGGVSISYALIKDGMFSFNMSGATVHYNFFLKNDLLEARELYEKFIKESGFDLIKVKIIRALIFLNMSPLHHDPFDVLLYYHGKVMLHKALLELEESKEQQ